MNKDYQLIEAVKRRITGSSLHEVYSFIGYYMSSVDLFNSGKEIWRKPAELAEEAMRRFVASGDLNHLEYPK